MATEDISDDEIESLMAELEAESSKIVAEAEEAKAVKAIPTKVEEPDKEFDPNPSYAPSEVTKAIYAEAKAVEDEDIPDEVEEAHVVRAPVEEEVKLEKALARIDPPEPIALPKPTPVEEEKEVEEAKPVKGLQHYVDVNQFRTDTKVTEASLDACMIEQNGLRAYYGATAANAEAQAARLKARFEVVEATLYDHHRKELALAGEKTTEKMVENAVKLDPRWFKAKNTVIEAETIASINKALVESLKDRRDMIIQLGADRRDEYKGQARTLAERSEAESFLDRAKNSAR